MTSNSPNKTQPHAGDVFAFLDRLKDPVKRADSDRLISIMTKASGDRATMWGPSIIGFGSYHYRYASGREGDAPAIGFSPRSNAISVYITGSNELRGDVLARFGKHKVGKGCIYVKRFSDIDESVLDELIEDGLALARDIDERSR
ncbi:MAG TPA: DUF1801 domain-containing protein [Aeromicrobium sp.]|nr:DUF1801 domain-containing protein [Aeromicrobium sp.]